MREATLDDMPDLMRFGRAFHEASGQPFPFEEETTRAFLASIIENPAGVILVTDSGMIGGIIAPAYCASTWKMAVELFWWAEKGGMVLLKAFEQWAAEQGAKEVRMTSLASLPRADAILKRKGFAPAEISYRKVI